jgi:MoxR-like ATPase
MMEPLGEHSTPSGGPRRRYPYYRGDSERAGAGTPVELDLPTPAADRLRDSKRYVPDPGLRDAVNVALILGQPLLLTGEPGTGKTQLAASLAWEIGLEPVLRFVTKSTSVSTDLFYTYNSLARFHDAQIHVGASPPAGAEDGVPVAAGSGPDAVAERGAEYLNFNALGRAILLANPPHGHPRWLDWHARLAGAGEEPRRSVVLIDEIDKAPRDFPNDLLDEIERLEFRIPELSNTAVSIGKGPRPVVVITSNSEKNLPGPFLRRCVYYHIPFPDKERLKLIVTRQLAASFGGEPTMDLERGLLDEALRIFDALRSRGNNQLTKPPGTAELLNWVLAVRRIDPTSPNPLAGPGRVLEQTLGSLVKNEDDLDNARQLLDPWLQPRGMTPP